MPSPLPGMNPYLENPELWPEVHHRLISAIANAIESNLSQDYRVAIEKRVYTSLPEDAVLVGIPDTSVVSQSRNRQSFTTLTVPASDSSMTVMLPIPEEIRESCLEIRDIATGAAIAAIEVLSPINKRPGKGRDTYEKKRNAVLESATHLVEIDLLREGTPMVMVGNIPQSHYRILVSRAPQRPRAQLYAFNLQQAIPLFPLPLKPKDAELSIDLQSLVLQVYNQARYDLAIDYHQDPIPPLQEADRIWVDALLQAKGVAIACYLRGS
ncbi:hypothetical protein WA1_25605 [Scytonema hofmannii PCC 7110]|uniref:DUF4058 domain-containing protein n=1 Tax=Scytonema hofmannii PCC 7110 TaxID=128403 RepID=A0A139X795_9CYAN|nr:DUF4058 family protein [Scytonema hofmannii]KYC40502.1 hypothetical protein WA1_25605 [Scytonema hofmannii PCC 7110]